MQGCKRHSPLADFFSRFLSLEARPEVESKRPALRNLIERFYRVELEDDSRSDETHARADAVQRRCACV
jgi:hypothetical protein